MTEGDEDRWNSRERDCRKDQSDGSGRKNGTKPFQATRMNFTARKEPRSIPILRGGVGLQARVGFLDRYSSSITMLRPLSGW